MNLKYILIVVILIAVVGWGILAWLYLLKGLPEAKTPEKLITSPGFNLEPQKLATVTKDWQRDLSDMMLTPNGTQVVYTLLKEGETIIVVGDNKINTGKLLTLRTTPPN